MREGYWVIRTYKAGSVGEKTKFWVDARRAPRNAKRLKTDVKKALANEHSTVKTVARLINANFGKGDYLIGLDYSKAGYRKLIKSIEGYKKMSEAQRMEAIRTAAEHEMRLCFRRVQYALGKEEKELTYLGVTSDMDGKTGEAVRIHHHVVVNRDSLAAFLDKWTLGGVEYETLTAQRDYMAVAVYLMEQVRRVPDAKKYSPSRNLARPQPVDRIAKDGRMMTPPKGAVVIEFDKYRIGKPQYMRYILPEAADLGGTVYAKTTKKRE